MGNPRFDASNVRNLAWDAIWGNINIGGTDETGIEMDQVFKAIKIGSAGDVKLDDWFVGLGDKARIEIASREVVQSRITPLIPWLGSGLTPPTKTRMYQYAQPAILHASDNSGPDIRFFKTVPVQGFSPKRDGVKDDVWPLMLYIYPDQSLLAQGLNCYCDLVGATAASPSALTPTVASSTEIDLAWTINAIGSASQKVQKSSDLISWTTIATPTNTTNTYSATGLITHTKYYFRVLATDAGGDGYPSNVANATTS